MFYSKIPWFYQNFKNEILFFKSVFNSRSENTGPVNIDHIGSFHMINENLYDSKGFRNMHNISIF